jgi:Zn-dependent oligopeptidase
MTTTTKWKMLTDVPLAAQIDEVVRELALREKVYPAWVERGKIRPEIAAKHMERMRAVLQTLMSLEGNKRDVNADRVSSEA